jgi:hypothetical protein
MSEIGDVTGYTTTSGSKPLLKVKTEKNIVKGEIKTTDNAIVAVITASKCVKSINVAFQRNIPKIHVAAPMVTPLTRANVTITRSNV